MTFLIFTEQKTTRMTEENGAANDSVTNGNSKHDDR